MLKMQSKLLNRVKAQRMTESLRAFENACDTLRDTFRNTLANLNKLTEGEEGIQLKERSLRSTSMRSKPSRLVWDRVNNAVWIRSAGIPATTPLDLKRPIDRNGRLVSDRWTTTDIDAALRNFRESVDALHHVVTNQLRQLSGDMLSHLDGLSACTGFALAMATVDSHARNAATKQWVMPDLDSDRQGLNVTGVWPYWLDKESAVVNDISLSSMAILTGPNMAGKSTLLRSLGALALLALSGFAVPAKSASVPVIDIIMLRSASRDSPVEGKSSFAVEMREMKAVTAVATNKSLVLIDELCRGTEVSAGAAIAAAFLNKLDKVGCFGVFSTHLHRILDMLDAGMLTLDNTVELKMEVGEDSKVHGERRLAHTWKVMPGRSRASLAFQVARDEGVDDDVLRTATAFHDEFEVAVQSGHLGNYTCRVSEPSINSLEEKTTITESTVPMRDGKMPTYAAVGTDPRMARAITFKVAMDQLRDVAGNVEIGIITSTELPSATTIGKSVVYVFCTRSGGLYVGQTDCITQRISQHRREHGSDIIACYAIVTEGGATAARLLEGRLIASLRNKNFAVLNSDKDLGKRIRPSSN